MSAQAAAGAALAEEVIDAAITWAVKLNYSQAAPATRAAFEAWLHADARHALAWQRVGSLGQGLREMPAQLAQGTLQRASVLREDNRSARAKGRRKALGLLSLTGVTLAAGWLLRQHAPWQRLVAEASTAVGEQRRMQLADGTTLLLNTDSAVSTDLTGERRLITLWRGEILVTTGLDAGAASKRPFYVYTPFGKLQALGTRFVVRLEKNRARVSVQEGAVSLHPAGGGAAVVVHPGQSSWLADASASEPQAQTSEADAWAEGVIAGREMRLAELLEELSRYRPGRIDVDERVADLRVTGVFHVRDTDKALQFLRQTQPVVIRYRTRYWVTVGPEEA